MWEWFADNRLWIFIASIAGLICAYTLRHRAARAMTGTMPRHWKKRHKHLEETVSWIIFAVASGVFGPALATVITSYYQIDLLPSGPVAWQWFLDHGIPILIISVPAYVAYRIIKATMPHFLEKIIKMRGKRRTSKARLEKRSRTLSAVLTAIIAITIAVVASFMVLSEVGVNITPLLAGAGVVGIAVGLGAQSMIKDLIAGMFIIAEDQYDVGDVIRVNNDLAGGVEGLNMRRTTLRDLDGVLHIVPNGQINIASNLTKVMSRAHLNIGVAYKEDLDRVMRVIREVWEEAAADPDWEASFHDKTPALMRVDDFGDSAINIKVMGETEPGEHWNVMGELRRRVKRRFDEEGIEIPWPHVKLYMGDGEKGIVCPKCSHPNPPQSSFCSKCGAKLGKK